MRWIRRILKIISVILIVATIGGIAFEQWTRWQAPRTLQPDGKLVELDGRRSHIVCAGSGAPTVILESGLDSWGALSWVRVQPEIAKITRVCAYDRAGVAWSEHRAGPRDAGRIAEELHELLRASSEKPPYVMVGHSLGGMYARVFGGRFGDEVAGFVFVDSSHPDQDEKIPPPRWAGATMWLMRGASETGLLRLGSVSPRPWLTPMQQRSMEAFQPSGMRSVQRELGALPTTSEQDRASGPFGDRPLVVLAAGETVIRTPVWMELQADLAGLSTHSEHRIVEGAGHYIQHDHPEAVVKAIADVVQAVRHQEMR